MEILTVKNLSFSYPACRERVLNDISFSLRKGDFVTLCGATGSGKSTLLRMLKREITPAGEKNGEILFYKTPLESLSPYDSARKIGFVRQRAEHQTVTDKVWHELAFGPESLKLPQGVIRRRVAEISGYFGIESWFERDISELSGGQLQLLNLAAVMIMEPELLILDEPTARLDPIAAADFISVLLRLNRELSLTILAAEHRLEDILPVSSRLMAMENGRIAAFGDVRTTAQKLCIQHKIPEDMPTAVRFYSLFDIKTPCPITVREGAEFIRQHFKNKNRTLDYPEYLPEKTAALEFSAVGFRYTREGADILKNLSFTVYTGEIFCILGGNGSGKTTLLETAAGLNRPVCGKIRVFGKKISEYKDGALYQKCLALLPQDVQTVFLKNTVREELGGASLPFAFDMERLAQKHPYDLSGGEQQLAALAKILSRKPRLLLLDEPTSGLDAEAKRTLSSILKNLKKSGVSVVIVTHDAEFAACCADRCALFFRGEILSSDVPQKFFSENSFYTTAASRMTRGYYDNAVTVEDAQKLCLLNGQREENHAAD